MAELSLAQIKKDLILKGPMFPEPMRVITEPRMGSGHVMVDPVGTRTSRFQAGVYLTPGDMQQIEIEFPGVTCDASPALFRLGLEAIRIRLAYEFDPFFGLSISRVDPLPHQLDAVYNHMLKAWRCRFLLADDAGAGKTIMAGLLLKELQLRGLVERVLIICPANLAFQWRRELKDRFEEDFELVTGSRLRDAYSVNVWNQHHRIIASMDLAKLGYVVPSVEQADDWDLVIVDEAHRMSAQDADHKSERYRLGELLREKATHYLLLTATPHKGDPANFCLFLQLLDREAYADVRSIEEAMQRREAPFYLRRTKEAMLYFPRRMPDGTWKAEKIFRKRIPHTVAFELSGQEYALYQAVTNYVKQQSRRAFANGDDRRARAIGFLMAMYQRRMASSTYALKESLGRRARKLKAQLETLDAAGGVSLQEMPSDEDLEEMDDAEREEWEERLEQVTLARRRPELEAELREIEVLIRLAENVQASGEEVKLTRLREELTEKGIFADPSRRLLVFTEYKDTLDYLVKNLRQWGLSVGFIYGGMKPGSRDEQGTRLHTERQFWDLEIQVLVATEAAGEGINLHCCHVLFNYDIPWNPNRLEQRLGRIHRYGQQEDCLIFNFFARNTVEGRILRRLIDRLQEIRDALEDDAVFDIVGQVMPANQMERFLRDFYAGRMGEEDIQSRLEVTVNKEDFEHICRSALEGLAKTQLNLPMLMEQRAQATEHRIVPETIARFFQQATEHLGIPLRAVKERDRSFRIGHLPASLYEVARGAGWRLPPLARSYDRITFEREQSDRDPRFEWITPGHPLFEAVRRKVEEEALPAMRRGTVLYEIQRDTPSLLELYTAAVADGTGKTLHQQLFLLETAASGERRMRDPVYLQGLIAPEQPPEDIPDLACEEDASKAFLYEQGLQLFLDRVSSERQKDLDLIQRHVSLCFDELIDKRDSILTKHLIAKEKGDSSAEGLIEIESQKLIELQRRKARRLQEIQRQRALSLQGIERLAVALVLPYPGRFIPDISAIVPDPETERIAMEAVIGFEKGRGCKVEDVHRENLGYDIRSLHPDTGELRLIEIKGIGAAGGIIHLTPNEKRAAEDRPDVFWLYVVTHCKTDPILQEPIRNPARLPWNPVTKVDHFRLSVDAALEPMKLREESLPYKGEE